MWGLWNFQNIIGFTSSFLESLHDLIMVWLIVIMLCVLMVGYGVLKSPKGTLILDSVSLEVIWTLVPIFILISLAFPSIYLLCYQDSIKSELFYSVKIVGRQWSWGSEFFFDSADHVLDFDSLENFSSYENPVLVPLGASRFLVTSSDVLHSLGIPSLGVKLDAVPGRLNFTTVEVSCLGLSWASCYELCGNGHSAMPLFFLSSC